MIINCFNFKENTKISVIRIANMFVQSLYKINTVVSLFLKPGFQIGLLVISQQFLASNVNFLSTLFQRLDMHMKNEAKNLKTALEGISSC